jgi:hypothetical protein
MKLPSSPELAESQLPSPPPKPKFTEDPADPAAERTREAAFDATHTWAGKELLPFSSSRKSLFLQHRLAMGAPDLFRCMKDLDAFLADASRILFLCSYHPTAPITPDGDTWSRLRSDPYALQAVIDDWADAHIPAGSEAAATMTGYQIYSSSLANRHEPAPAPRASSDELGN